MKGRLPTPEERALWQQATRHDIQWRAEAPVDAPPVPEKAPSGTRATPPTPPLQVRQAKKTAPALIPDDVTALDGARGRRLKRGMLPIEWVVDLHGMSRETAYREVTEALAEASAHRMRCIAIVTGKGRGGEGILRREVPLWLNEGALRAMVVALVAAPAHLGGAGAYLVYLRKPERMTV